MTETNSSGKKSGKLILENPFIGSLIVPIAIVLVGALIIFGVTKLLSSDRSYRDLVDELQSKTFGNKWVAAYELSKKLNSSQIPKSDYPWLVENLSLAYLSSADPRTRGFIIAALGSMREPLSKNIILKALSDSDKEVQFHAVVALGNLPKESMTGGQFDSSLLIEKLKGDDQLLKQSAMLVLATFKVAEAQDLIRPFLRDQNVILKYSAATALINFQDEVALEVLSEILLLKEPALKEKDPLTSLDASQIADFKMGVLLALNNTKWTKLNDKLEEVVKVESNAKIALKAKDTLINLKN